MAVLSSRDSLQVVRAVSSSGFAYMTFGAFGADYLHRLQEVMSIGYRHSTKP